MKGITLNATNAGMTRLREKGGADPRTLYELTNGYVNASKVPTQRPGTRWIYTWPERTKGLMSFKDVLYSFSTQIIDTGRDDFKVLTLRHPDLGFEGDVYEVNFNAPMLGYPLVSATFRPTGADDDSTDTTYLYWLRVPDKWAANTMYKEGDRVEPATANGYYYEAHANENPPAWAPGVERAMGDVVQPTVYNGFKYTVVDTSSGTGPGGGGEGGDSCLIPDGLTRLTQANISYGPVNPAQRPNLDITQWDNFFGYGSVEDTETTPWPGVHGAGPVVRNFGKTNFIALHFNTGDAPEDRFGSISYPSNIGGPNIDLVISTQCGDFAANEDNAGASVFGAASDDNPAIRFRVISGDPDFYAILQPNTDYWLNIRASDPDDDTEAPGPSWPLYLSVTWG